MGNTMKAVSYRAYGGLGALELGERPKPRLSPGSVLIKVRAAAVNPVDWKIMSGGLDPIMDVHFPVVPGWDVAGVVEAVGFDTPEFSPGDEVYSYGRRDAVGGGGPSPSTWCCRPASSRTSRRGWTGSMRRHCR